MECKAHVTARASADGQSLQIKSLDEHHNHEVNELFRNLFHQRKLDETQKENLKQMLDVKANKKVIASSFMQATGKVILLKDIHNLTRKATNSATDENILQRAVNELLACPGAFVKIETDENNEMVGLFFQDARMRAMFEQYPEFLCVDATYKLNNLRMPLYLLIAENGNGQSEVVGMWIVANETEETILKMVNIFKEQNPKWQDITRAVRGDSMLDYSNHLKQMQFED